MVFSQSGSYDRLSYVKFEASLSSPGSKRLVGTKPYTFTAMLTDVYREKEVEIYHRITTAKKEGNMRRDVGLFTFVCSNFGLTIRTERTAALQQRAPNADFT
nr:unnamed protein product [Spirometra erinaceieuropaei]